MPKTIDAFRRLVETGWTPRCIVDPTGSATRWWCISRIGEVDYADRRYRHRESATSEYAVAVSMPSHVARNLLPRVEEALADTRIVVIQGARQVGKSTLAGEITRHRGGRLVTLDDDVTRTAAATDPHSFVRQFPDGLLTIDEVQRVPELVVDVQTSRRW